MFMSRCLDEHSGSVEKKKNAWSYIKMFELSF